MQSNARQESKLIKPRLYLSDPNKNASKSSGKFRDDSPVLENNPRIIYATTKTSNLPVTNSFTQTSKTILELANLEKGSISPDSLSPPGNRNSKFNSPRSRGSSTEDVSYKGVFYTRKSSLVKYLDNCSNELTITKGKNVVHKPLIQTFLSKTNKPRNCVGSSGGSSPKKHVSPKENYSRSRFLQQTSPLKKLVDGSAPTNKFKSFSYVEGPKPRKIVEDIREEPTPPRYKVKVVREKPPEEKQKLEPQKIFGLETLHLSSKIDKSIDSHSNSMEEYRSTGRRNNSFMSPTVSSINKNKKIEYGTYNALIPSTRRGRSTSPSKAMRGNKQDDVDIPYIDVSDSDNSERTNVIMSNEEKEDFSSSKNTEISLDGQSQRGVSKLTRVEFESGSTDCDSFYQAINKLKDTDWNRSLMGLAEVVEICRVTDSELIFPHMITINQRLIELLKSPRSHVCRTACQATGHLFEFVKDTRRPEFDEIVNTLLAKTADSNKFIRQDANLSLDCMVTHIPTSHAVRVLTSKGPDHKNGLVRTATARLLVCAVVIAGAANIVRNPANDLTRKRIVMGMLKFLEDKCLETRKFGHRLYKQLQRDSQFENVLKRYISPEEFVKIKRIASSNIKK